MTPVTIPTAEPFYFPGGKTACLLVHGFTGSPKEMRVFQAVRDFVERVSLQPA